MSLPPIVESRRLHGTDAVCGDLVYVRQDRPNEVLRDRRCGAVHADRRLKLRLDATTPDALRATGADRELGGFDMRLRIAADYEFMLRYLGRPGPSVAYVPEVLVKMRTGCQQPLAEGAAAQEPRRPCACSGVGTVAAGW